jgi:phosphoglycerol transferase MdoB-like AlkP superfamily enzyme
VTAAHPRARVLAAFAMAWVALTLWMSVFKLVFMLVEPQFSLSDLLQLPAVIWHGLPMDLSVSGYLVAPVALIALASVWTAAINMRAVISWWRWIVAALISIISVIDLGLYPYWGFRLDTTPIFYFTTSPASAAASVEWWMWLASLIVTVIATWGIAATIAAIIARILPAAKPKTRRAQVSPWLRAAWSVVWAIVLGIVFIAMRGGITVSTMAPGRSYFSHEMRLNHAALNPMFTLLYSATHADNYGDQFQFYDRDTAEQLAGELSDSRVTPASGNIAPVSLTTSTPDIYLVILESFSASLMPSLGGTATAVNLDSIATNSLSFTDFYAESFRTDRGLVSILSAVPAQPTTSLLRYVDKFSGLPSLATVLKDRAGYESRYYYGGDIDFTNMRGWLISQRFDKIVGDTDFPIDQRLSKWGVHDGPLVDRVMSELPRGTDPPRLTVVQTSSSHEPFEVPYYRFAEPRRNAFAYADSCLAVLVNAINASGRGDRSLIVITADHWGAWPDLKDRLARHHIPLVITGRALGGRRDKVGKIGSQSAIAGTVLGLVGIHDPSLAWTRDMLDSDTSGMAWLSEPSWFGIVTPRGLSAVGVDDDRLLDGRNNDAARARAYLQTLYHWLSTR